MLDLHLARQLRDAGLRWDPTEGDRFVLPDRDMDDEIFTVSRMVVEVHTAPIGQVIAFNGTMEWALDAVEQAETVWLPREAQLREALGQALLSLVRTDEGWRCTTRLDGGLAEVDAPTADQAYAKALLAQLQARAGR